MYKSPPNPQQAKHDLMPSCQVGIPKVWAYSAQSPLMYKQAHLHGKGFPTRSALAESDGSHGSPACRDVDQAFFARASDNQLVIRNKTS